MSLGLNTNVPALNAHRFLRGADQNLTKSINRLSSGLRINSAADDPSGLAISQRLRTQHLGIDRAIMNSQDAVSYLQTAESALDESQNILQRMRELAIQASNGTLTSSDRQEIQKEVDQLKQEVNRIATSSEFNTKKLLDGSASALWSSSSDDVTVVVRGAVQEGNYELEIDTTPVENHVLKTDIFKVKAAAQGVENVDVGATHASYTLTGTSANAGTIDFDFGAGGTYSMPVNAGITSADLVAQINQDEKVNEYVRAFQNAAGNVVVEAIVEGEEGNAYSIQASGNNVGFVTDGLAHNLTGGVDYPAGITGIGSPDNLPPSDNESGTYRIYADNVVSADAAGDTANIVAAYEQPVGGTITAATTAGAIVVDATAGNTTAQSGSGYAILEITQGGVVDGAGGTENVYARVSFDNGQTWFNTGDLDTGAAVTISDGSASFQINALNAGDVINTGDKLLIALNDRDYNNADHAEVMVETPFVDGQGNTTQVGPRWSFTSDSLNNKTTSVTIGHMDTNTGDIRFGTVDVDVTTLSTGDGDADLADNAVQSVTFDVNGGSGPAFGTTKLWQIDRFYDVDGNFILGDSGKYITIYNEAGSRSEIFIDPEDSIDEVADKIQNAIVKDTKDGGLGMGTGDNAIDDHIADFVESPTAGTDEALQGTMIIRSPWMGERGKLFFSAEEDILNALSLVTINTPDIDPMTITVRDAHTGKVVGEDTVADSTLHNVVAGVDIEFNPNLDVDITWDAGKREFAFSNSPGTVKEYVHIVNNAKSFQIGASEGQTMDSFIGEMTAHSLGIDNAMVVDPALAQKAMTKISNAIDQVSSERSRIGSIINRLDHTIKNLESQKESALSSEARIKDLDIAKESAEFAKNQMMTQAAQAMLGQANKIPQNLLQLLRG